MKKALSSKTYSYTLMVLFLFLTSCSSLYRSDQSSDFYGRYISHEGPQKKFMELVLEDEGRGYFLINEKKVPVLWNESLGHLVVTYLGSVDRYEASWLIRSETGERQFTIRYLERPGVPKGPHSPMMMIKVKSDLY